MTEKRKTVSKDLNNQKILKEVQATSDEASRLLADLDSSSNKKSDNTKRNASQKTNGGPHQPYKYKPNLIEAKPTADASGCIGAGILLFGIFLFFAIANYYQQTISQSDDTDKLPPTVIKPKIEKMNASQKRFYEKAFIKASDAVLKREHESAIMSLETLKSGKYKNLADVNIGHINNKIILAHKSIKYLDQKGKHPYHETSNYGYQWFDKMPENQFKVFFAFSKKCKEPVVTFGFKQTKDGVVKSKYSVVPSPNLSTLIIPMQLSGVQWITPPDVECG